MPSLRGEAREELLGDRRPCVAPAVFAYRRSDSLGPVSIRRAVERPIPVVATTRSRISPLSAFEALRY